MKDNVRRFAMSPEERSKGKHVDMSDVHDVGPCETVPITPGKNHWDSQFGGGKEVYK